MENIEELKEDKSAVASLLSNSRQEMYGALTLFQTHVKYTTSLMFSIMAGVLAIFSFTIKETGKINEYQEFIEAISATLLFSLLPISILSLYIIGRYYQLYVSALVFSAELHHHLGGKCHPWFFKVPDDIFDDGQKKHEYVKERTWGFGHTLFYYSILLGGLGVVGFGLAIALLIK